MEKAYLLLSFFVYSFVDAQTSLFLTSQARITVTARAKVCCHSVTWLGDATIRLGDSVTWNILSSTPDAILGFDNVSRFFILGDHACLGRSIGQGSSYVFPIGYDSNPGAYRGFTLDMKSLGATGSAPVSVRLTPNVSGTINYQKYFPSNDPSCAAGSWVAFNCLSHDGWHCDGPSDYEYVVSGQTSNTCGSPIRRMIKTATGSNAWQDSVESVVGNFSSNLCSYSDWTGNASNILGGTYRDFSDFAIASSSSILPVTLVDLRADVLSQKYIRVSWQTEVELNNDKFIIERSTDGIIFSHIGEIAGGGTITTPQDYFFDDGEVVPNTVYYYRLEQVDYDGTSHWSAVVSAVVNQEEVLETRRINILGQEIPENTLGFQLIQVRTKSGVTLSKLFKPLP